MFFDLDDLISNLSSAPSVFQQPTSKNTSSFPSDDRLTTSSLLELGKIFWILKLPLKFKIVDEQLKLGRYTGTQMRIVFENSSRIFACSPFPDQKNLWSEFYSCLSLLLVDPCEGETQRSIAAQFQQKFDEWKKLFLGRAGKIDPEWRIYLHILECHAADLFEMFGNLHPWANEAGEHLHALDRMSFFQKSRKGTLHQLATKILLTALRTRWSQYQLGIYQTNIQIPEDLRKVKPQLARSPTTHFSSIIA